MKGLSNSVLIVVFLFLCLSCGAPEENTEEMKIEAENSLRQADLDWSASAKDFEAFIGFFENDAVMLMSNAPAFSGVDEIRANMEGPLSDEGFSIEWVPNHVEVANSGDLGYTIGTYSMTMEDSTGMSMVENGKYLTVWKKQADGTWKVAADMGNSNEPMPEH
ncbi:YybH family protein [Echinicola shivajiensis]|uniref:YybH family protein n=1 Tax=Echinicola shivajiensis TaxID=1035916 RepID=UPI001BFC9840|nr:DUF4440 domain-containing protein [Echinicola shivajiensis]